MLQRVEDVYTGLRQDKPFLVKDLAESWFLNIKDMMRLSTYARYHSYAEKYILPYVGSTRVDVFDKTALSAMLALLRAGHSQQEPLSQYTVYFVENMVRAMFRYGAEKHIIPEISFGQSEYKIQSKKYAMPLTELEVMHLVHIVEQQELDFQLQIILPLYTGVSLSELCGLKWEDIDIKNNKIHVHRNLVRIQKRAENDSSVKSTENSNSKNNDDTTEKVDILRQIKLIGNSQSKKSTILAECELPKNSCRKFVMPEKVSALLNAVVIMKNPSKERYIAELEKKNGKGRKASVELLSSRINTQDTQAMPPDARSLQYRVKTVGEKAGIPDLTYQMLRDTFAVMSLNAGGDPYSVACVMGVGVNVVCDRYGMWLVKDDRFLKGI